MSERIATGEAADPVASPHRISWGEGAFALVLVALGVITLSDGLTQPASTSASGVGAGHFPIIVGSAMLLAAVLLVVQVLRGRRAEPEEADGEVDTSRTRWASAAVTIAAILFFALTVDSLGYVVSATVTFAAIAIALGSRKWITIAIVSIVLPVAVFYLFTLGLNIRLPAGILTGIL